jgi:hypothetical protein
MSRRSRIVVILEVAQTSVCVPVKHIVRDPFTKIAATLIHCRRSHTLSFRPKRPGFFLRSICERRAA